MDIYKLKSLYAHDIQRHSFSKPQNFDSVQDASLTFINCDKRALMKLNTVMLLTHKTAFQNFLGFKFGSVLAERTLDTAQNTLVIFCKVMFDNQSRLSKNSAFQTAIQYKAAHSLKVSQQNSRLNSAKEDNHLQVKHKLWRGFSSEKH